MKMDYYVFTCDGLCRFIPSAEYAEVIAGHIETSKDIWSIATHAYPKNKVFYSIESAIDSIKESYPKNFPNR